MAERACRLCGCTEENGCAGGCSWAEAADGVLGDLCSACLSADQVLNEMAGQIGGIVLRAVTEAYRLGHERGRAQRQPASTPPAPPPARDESEQRAAAKLEQMRAELVGGRRG